MFEHVNIDKFIYEGAVKLYTKNLSRENSNYTGCIRKMRGRYAS